uniref:Candidate secreted effector n=1 Tax=Meloidogyne incognita TaxID=6306 RepID=A0A914KJH9_MELIC
MNVFKKIIKYNWNIIKKEEILNLINFFNGWTSSSTSATTTTWHTTSSRHSTRHTSRHSSTTRRLIKLRNDRIANSFQFLLMMLKFFLLSSLVGV